MSVLVSPLSDPMVTHTHTHTHTHKCETGHRSSRPANTEWNVSVERSQSETKEQKSSNVKINRRETQDNGGVTIKRCTVRTRRDLDLVNRGKQKRVETTPSKLLRKRLTWMRESFFLSHVLSTVELNGLKEDGTRHFVLLCSSLFRIRN